MARTRAEQKYEHQVSYQTSHTDLQNMLGNPQESPRNNQGLQSHYSGSPGHCQSISCSCQNLSGDFESEPSSHKNSSRDCQSTSGNQEWSRSKQNCYQNLKDRRRFINHDLMLSTTSLSGVEESCL